MSSITKENMHISAHRDVNEVQECVLAHTENIEVYSLPGPY